MTTPRPDPAAGRAPARAGSGHAATVPHPGSRSTGSASGPSVPGSGRRGGPPGGDDRARAGLAGLARGSLANLAGAGFAGASGLAIAWLAARGLAPAMAGGFFAATAGFLLVAGVAKLGTPTGLVYWIARLRTTGQPSRIGACLRAALAPVVTGSVLLAIALWTAAPVLAGLIGAPATGTMMLRVLAVFVPLAALTDALLAATRGYRRMRPTVALDRILRCGLQVTGLAVLALLSLWWQVPPAGWVLGWALPYLPVLLLAGYAAAATHRRYLRRRDPSAAEAAPAGERVGPTGAIGLAFWRYTGPRALASWLQLALQRLDIVLVAGIAGPLAAALYTVAGRFIVVGQLTNQAITNAVQPRLAEALSRGEHATAGQLYRIATSWLVLTSWPYYLLVMNFATFYLGLFGPVYQQAVPVVLLLGLAMLLATGCGMVDTLLVMAGRTSWNLLNAGLALTTMVGLDLLLVPSLGITGAAIGLAAAIAVNNLLPLAQVGYLLRLHPFGTGTVASAALAAGCFGVLPALATGVLGTSVTMVTASLGTGLIGYLAGTRRLRRELALPEVVAAVVSLTAPVTRPARRSRDAR